MNEVEFIFIFIFLSFMTTIRALKTNEDGNANVGRQKIYIFLRNPRILLSISLVTLYVSIFPEIALTPASHDQTMDINS